MTAFLFDRSAQGQQVSDLVHVDPAQVPGGLTARQVSQTGSSDPTWI